MLHFVLPNIPQSFDQETNYFQCLRVRKKETETERQRENFDYPANLPFLLENAAPCSLIPPYSKHKACCDEAPSSSKRPCSFRSPFNHSMCGRPTSNTHRNSNTFHAVFLYSFNSHWPLLSLIPCSSCPPPPPNSFRRFPTE